MRTAIQHDPRDVVSAPISILVASAAGGDEWAWRALVKRYDGLVRSGVRRVAGLRPEDYEDAAATTWLALVDQIGRLRNPAAIASWLATTSYRESLRVARGRKRAIAMETELMPETLGAEADVDAGLLRDQILEAILDSGRDLSPTGRRLLLALIEDPEASYKEIEMRHGVRVSSIGPIRERVFRTLRGALGEIGVTGSVEGA